MRSFLCSLAKFNPACLVQNSMRGLFSWMFFIMLRNVFLHTELSQKPISSDSFIHLQCCVTAMQNIGGKKKTFTPMSILELIKNLTYIFRGGTVGEPCKLQIIRHTKLQTWIRTEGVFSLWGKDDNPLHHCTASSSNLFSIIPWLVFAFIWGNVPRIRIFFESFLTVPAIELLPVITGVFTFVAVSFYPELSNFKSPPTVCSWLFRGELDLNRFTFKS